MVAAPLFLDTHARTRSLSICIQYKCWNERLKWNSKCAISDTVIFSPIENYLNKQKAPWFECVCNVWKSERVILCEHETRAVRGEKERERERPICGHIRILHTTHTHTIQNNRATVNNNKSNNEKQKSLNHSYLNFHFLFAKLPSFLSLFSHSIMPSLNELIGLAFFAFPAVI